MPLLAFSRLPIDLTGMRAYLVSVDSLLLQPPFAMNIVGFGTEQDFLYSPDEVRHTISIATA